MWLGEDDGRGVALCCKECFSCAVWQGFQCLAFEEKRKIVIPLDLLYRGPTHFYFLEVNWLNH